MQSKSKKRFKFTVFFDLKKFQLEQKLTVSDLSHLLGLPPQRINFYLKKTQIPINFVLVLKFLTDKKKYTALINNIEASYLFFLFPQKYSLKFIKVKYRLNAQQVRALTKLSASRLKFLLSQTKKNNHIQVYDWRATIIRLFWGKKIKEHYLKGY